MKIKCTQFEFRTQYYAPTEENQTVVISLFL